MSGIEERKITHDGITFFIIGAVEDNDYDWSAEAILKRESDGQLFWATDSGCSCYAFGDGLELEPIYSIDEGLRKCAQLDRPKMELSIANGGEIQWR